MAPAVLRASSLSSLARRRAYTGIKEAERTPSPKRFCKRLGMRKAARKASAASELPKKWAKTRSRISPVMRLRRIPAATRNAKRLGPDG